MESTVALHSPQTAGRYLHPQAEKIERRIELLLSQPSL